MLDLELFCVESAHDSDEIGFAGAQTHCDPVGRSAGIAEARENRGRPLSLVVA